MALDGTNAEDINHQETLKAAVHFTVGRICDEVGAKLGLTYSKQVIATLSEVINKQLETYTTDLEAFSKHAKRSTVNVDDVKLLVRRNPELLAHVQQMSESLEPLGGTEKKKRGRKSKEVASPVDLEHEVVELEDDHS